MSHNEQLMFVIGLPLLILFSIISHWISCKYKIELFDIFAAITCLSALLISILCIITYWFYCLHSILST